MTRPSQKSRVSEPSERDDAGRRVEPGLPSLRERRPFMFWAVVIGTLAMVLTVITGFFLSAGGGHGG